VKVHSLKGTGTVNVQPEWSLAELKAAVAAALSVGEDFRLSSGGRAACGSLRCRAPFFVTEVWNDDACVRARAGILGGSGLRALPQRERADGMPGVCAIRRSPDMFHPSVGRETHEINFG
jgi:hypothetical protein